MRAHCQLRAQLPFGGDTVARLFYPMAHTMEVTLSLCKQENACANGEECDDWIDMPINILIEV